MIRVHPARRRDFARWARRHRIRTVSSTEFGVPDELFPKIPAELLEGALVDGRRILAPPPVPKAKLAASRPKAKVAKTAAKAATPLKTAVKAAPRPQPAPTPPPTPKPEPQPGPPPPAAEPGPEIVSTEPGPEPEPVEPEMVIAPTTAGTVGMQPEVLAAAARLLAPDGGESPGHCCDDPACPDCGGPQPGGTPPAGHGCPHCDRSFGTAHGLGIHQRRMHRDQESS